MALTERQRVLPQFRFSVVPKGDDGFIFLGYTDQQHPNPHHGFFRYWPAAPDEAFDESMLLKVRAVSVTEIECWETEAIPFTIEQQ